MRRVNSEFTSKKQSNRVASITILCLLLVATLFLFPSPGNRSIAGRLVRFAEGHPMAIQTADDLAEDILERKDLQELQQWSVETIERYKQGKIATDGNSSYWSTGSLK